MKEPAVPLILNMLIINAIISINISGLLADNQLKGQEKECYPSIRLWRNTVRKTYTQETLRINCTVQHCGSTLTVEWCKIEMESTCAIVNESDHIRIQWEQKKEDPDAAFLFLDFKNISMKDSGRYRCEITGDTSSVSHSINVSVLVPECRTEVLVPEKRLRDVQVSSSPTLSCMVRYAYESRAVTWCKQQGELCIQLETGEKQNISWHQLDPNTGVCLLTFLSVSLSDSGEYRCKVYQRKACGDTIFSPSLQLYVTTESGVLDLVVNVGRIFFFIAVTVAVILLTLCWALKLKGKLFPRDRPPTHSPASQELLEVPPPPRCQQPGMEMPDDDPSADSEPSDYANCI